MERNDKILIVGAGIGQVNLCKLAKERGLFVIVVTIPDNYPCIDIADKVLYIDIYDRNRIVEVARMEGVSAVISDQNDLMMPTVAYVAEKLGLPGNSFEQVNSYCNKNIFRKNCDILSIPSPKHCKVVKNATPSIFETIPFPWMVKPEDSQSSIGVRKVHNQGEYFKALAEALRLSKNNTAIVEEFFTGNEVVAEGFIYKGQYYNLGFADRKYFDLEKAFIPCQTIFPSTIPSSIKGKIIEYEQSYAKFVNPEFGIVHSEYLINSLGEVRVVESALRGGGVYISSHLIPLFNGININNILLDCALGDFKESQLDIFRDIEEKASAYVCFYLHEGTVCSIDGIDEIKQLQYVHKCDIDIKVGDKTKAMNYKGNRYGPIIVSGENRKDIEQKILKIQSLLHIIVQDNKYNKHDIIWK